jgi:hypothetical protein
MNIIPLLKIGIRKGIEFGTKNSSSILTGISALTTVWAVVSGISATPKALYLIQDEETRNPDLSNFEKLKVTWKCYIPTAFFTIISISTNIGSNNISLRRNAALSGLYALSEKALNEYKHKVIETIGERKEEKIRDAISQDHLNKDPLSKKDIIVLGKGDTLFYDSLSGRYFKTEIEAVRKIQNDFNARLLREMCMSINELYYEIGLEGTELGKSLGWNIDNGLLDIHFSSKIAEGGIPCIVLDFKNVPTKIW